MSVSSVDLIIVSICTSFVSEQLPGRSQGQFGVCVCARVIYIEPRCHVGVVCSHTKQRVTLLWQHCTDSVAFYLFKVISSLRSMSDKWGNLVTACAR